MDEPSRKARRDIAYILIAFAIFTLFYLVNPQGVTNAVNAFAHSVGAH